MSIFNYVENTPFFFFVFCLFFLLASTFWACHKFYYSTAMQQIIKFIPIFMCSPYNTSITAKTSGHNLLLDNTQKTEPFYFLWVRHVTLLHLAVKGRKASEINVGQQTIFAWWHVIVLDRFSKQSNENRLHCDFTALFITSKRNGQAVTNGEVSEVVIPKICGLVHLIVSWEAKIQTHHPILATADWRCRNPL